MRLIFAEQAWEDYLFWQQTAPKITRRIHALISDATRHPFEGIGKPEPLRHALAGYWSRRITDEHRMVYKAAGRDLLIAQLRYHY
ncbi:MAG TPA: Txe/YoeB family addiction module toxin [Verrucomicrobiota bacterium]|nr:Txe/YoeB family addiction module toxin [Verrucomicrobiota bacterium]HNU50303.1 Txe/YoeB family addiction module toxin [Verrucomicrobiota bacterium]